ncbi:hypothetical protein ACFL2D_00635 [Patescibacteria group bacterium]
MSEQKYPLSTKGGKDMYRGSLPYSHTPHDKRPDFRAPSITSALANNRQTVLSALLVAAMAAVVAFTAAYDTEIATFLGSVGK